MRAIILNDTDPDHQSVKHMGCLATMTGLRTLLADSGIEVVGSVPSGRAYDPAALPDHDLAIINGEGTMHGGSPRAKALLDTAQKELLGHKVWLVNSEFFGMGGADEIELLSEFDHVAIRDSESILEAGENAVLSADCSWLLSPAPGVTRDGTLLVCAGIRAPDLVRVGHWAQALKLKPVFCNAFFPCSHAGWTPSTLAETFARFASCGAVYTTSYHGAVFAAMHGTFWAWQSANTPKLDTFAVECYGRHALDFGDPHLTARRKGHLEQRLLCARPKWIARARHNVPQPDPLFADHQLRTALAAKASMRDPAVHEDLAAIARGDDITRGTP